LPLPFDAMRIAFIANPYAGRGRTESFFREFQNSARDQGTEVAIHWTERPGHATEIARECIGNADVVCAVGGDGTVHEVVNGLMPDPIPLVVIPKGSGNDFARLFGCPTTAEELARVLAEGMGVVVDVIDMGERYSVNSAGLGFEALVTKNSRAIHHLRGLPLYLTAVFKAMLKFECPVMNVDLADGTTIAGRRLMLSVGNGVSAGGGFHLTPDAFPDDGVLDFCIVDPIGRLQILKLLPSAIPGKHVSSPLVQMARSSAATITTPSSFHVHVDGEYIGERSTLTFKLVPRCLPVLCLGNRATRTKSPPQPILSLPR